MQGWWSLRGFGNGWLQGWSARFRFFPGNSANDGGPDCLVKFNEEGDKGNTNSEKQGRIYYWAGASFSGNNLQCL